MISTKFDFKMIVEIKMSSKMKLTFEQVLNSPTASQADHQSSIYDEQILVSNEELYK